MRCAYVDRFGAFLPSYIRSRPRQTHLSRERDSPRALPPLLVATRPPRGPLHHAGLAATPSIRAPLPAIGSNQFQQRRQRRRPCDNGSLTCPHLPFSRSRTVSKKERRRLALVVHSALNAIPRLRSSAVRDTRLGLRFRHRPALIEIDRIVYHWSALILYQNIEVY